MLNIKINISGASSCLNNFLMNSIKLLTVKEERESEREHFSIVELHGFKSIKIEFQAHV